MPARPLTLVLAALPTVVHGSSTYVCVQFVNNDFPQYHVNTCQLGYCDEQEPVSVR